MTLLDRLTFFFSVQLTSQCVDRCVSLKKLCRGGGGDEWLKDGATKCKGNFLLGLYLYGTKQTLASTFGIAKKRWELTRHFSEIIRQQ